VLAGALAAPSLARAQSLWSGPLLDPATKLRVESESLTLTCQGGMPRASCAFEARARITNAAPAAAEATVVLFSAEATDMAFRAGDDTLSPLSGQDAKSAGETADRLYGAAFAPNGVVGLGPDLVRSAVRLRVPAQGAVELITTGRLRLTFSTPVDDLPFTIEALYARHPWGRFQEHETRALGFEYLASFSSTWSSPHQLRLKLRTPNDWSAEGRTVREAEDPGLFTPGFSLPSPAGEDMDERELRLDGPAESGVRAVTLHVDTRPPQPRFFHGGPYLGIGSGFGKGDLENFRMRVGYEISAPDWLIESLSFETDFRKRSFVTPAVELATRQFFFLPSVSAGLGIPIQVFPRASPGVRLLLGAQIFMVGIVGTVDLFPGLSTPEGRVQGSLMARFSM
jgi:hypothetical protein